MHRASLSDHALPGLALRRVAGMVALMLALMAQLWMAGPRSVAAATASEVCSASGMLRVTADGQPVPLAAMDHGHDCCVVAGQATLPTTPVLSMPTLSHASPVARLGSARLSAQALTPLSRGPPAFS